jgi:hypothetical protein
MSGEYADQPFDLGFGFETFFRQVAMFAFSVASLDCTPPVADQPPTSTTATAGHRQSRDPKSPHLLSG